MNPLNDEYEKYRAIEDNLASEEFIEFKQKLYKEFAKIIASLAPSSKKGRKEKTDKR